MSERPHEWHVASLVVRHREAAAPALAAAVDGARGLELAMQEPTCSILLQEGDGTASLMANIDMLQAVPGVMAVNLVYHHAERLPETEQAPSAEPQEQAG